MSFGMRLLPEVLRSAAFGAIGAGYAILGTPFTYPMRLINIQNNTNADLLISFNGVDDHVFIPAKTGIIWDFCANRVNVAGAFISAGTGVFVKQSGVPTSGSVYVSGFYGYGD